MTHSYQLGLLSQFPLYSTNFTKNFVLEPPQKLKEKDTLYQKVSTPDLKDQNFWNVPGSFLLLLSLSKDHHRCALMQELLSFTTITARRSFNYHFRTNEKSLDIVIVMAKPKFSQKSSAFSALQWISFFLKLINLRISLKFGWETLPKLNFIWDALSFLKHQLNEF